MNQTTFRQRIEENQVEETIIACLEKLSFGQLYQLQKEMQLELHDNEELFHEELQMVNHEKERYVEECAALRKEKEEVE